MNKRRKKKRKRNSHHRLRRSFFDDDPSCCCCCYCYSSRWIASCCASYYPASSSSSSGVCDATTTKTSKPTTTTATTNERCDGAVADADYDDLPRRSTRTYRRDGGAIRQSSSRRRCPPRDDCDVDADAASHRRRRRRPRRLRLPLPLLLLLRRSPLFPVGRRSRRRCFLHLREYSFVFPSPDRRCRGRVYRGIAACLRRSRKEGGGASCVAIIEIDAFLHDVVPQVHLLTR
jgi:hypothetical protein